MIYAKIFAFEVNREKKIVLETFCDRAKCKEIAEKKEFDSMKEVYKALAQSEFIPISETFFYRENPSLKLPSTENFLAKQEAKQAPMGVSQWRNHGKKYHYDKYFEDIAKQEGKKEVIEEVKELIGCHTATILGSRVIVNADHIEDSIDKLSQLK